MHYTPPGTIIHTATETVVEAPTSDPVLHGGLTNYQAAKQRLGAAHTCAFTSISGKQVKGTNRVILYRECSCSKIRAFELGEKEAMRELYLQLKAKEQA